MHRQSGFYDKPPAYNKENDKRYALGNVHGF